MSKFKNAVKSLFGGKPPLVDIGAKTGLADDTKIANLLEQNTKLSQINKLNAEAAALNPLGAKLKLVAYTSFAGIVAALGAYLGGLAQGKRDSGGGGENKDKPPPTGLCAIPGFDAACGTFGDITQIIALVLGGIVLLVVIWILVKVFGRGHGGPKFHLDG